MTQQWYQIILLTNMSKLKKDKIWHDNTIKLFYLQTRTGWKRIKFDTIIV